jgi:hypothetical protein
MTARLLCHLLTEPSRAADITSQQWPSILTIAQAERLAGTLAHRLSGLPLPSAVQSVLDAARLNADAGRVQALWEVEMAQRALAPLGVPVVLLKGSAFVAAGLDAGRGRQIGDLDILVPRDRLDSVEAALLKAGWEWVKPDPYDDIYYRRWMHELPPLIHQDRDRMIDVHHTILPLTARPRPDAAALIADAVLLDPYSDAGPNPEPLDAELRPSPEHDRSGLFTLSPADMIVHAAAHLIADGDLEGGLRNLWDIDRLVREFSEQDSDFCLTIAEQAQFHNLGPQIMRALRLSRDLFETPLKEYASPASVSFKPKPNDALFRARLLARNGWGQNTHRPLRFAFYIRSHLLRMPPLMLMRHLWIKARAAK